MDLRVTGADELSAVARRVRAAGGGLSGEFRTGLQRAAAPAAAAARRAAAEELPQRGGLAERVAGGTFTAKVRAGVGSAELTVTADAGMDLSAMDRGRLRHPTYGRPGSWVTQSIPPGWFTKRMEAEADRVVEPVVKAALDLLEKL